MNTHVDLLREESCRSGCTVREDISHLAIAEWFIDDPAAQYPDKAAIVDYSGVTSYRALADITNRASNALLTIACDDQERILIALPDSLELVYLFFAVSIIGAIPVLVSDHSSTSEFSQYLNETGATTAIVSAHVLAEFRKAATAALRNTVVVGDSANLRAGNEWSWQDLVNSCPATVVARASGGHKPAALLYTSGSTGHKKAVLHSHRSFISATQRVGSGVFRFNCNDRVLSMARLSFAFGLGFGLCFPLAAGASTLLNSNKLQLDHIAELISVNRPTIICGVPSVLASLARAARTWLPLDLSSVRFVVSAGEPLPISVFDEYRDRFGIEVLDGIGSTEMLTHFISNRPFSARRGSCGMAVPGYEVSLRDEFGRPVPRGEIGTLWVRGDSTLLRYWNRPNETPYAERDGWLSTGDRLYEDGDGFYVFCGRADDMLKIAGLWVSPQIVESAISTFADVQQAFVTSQEMPTGLYRLVAYVVLSAGVELNVLKLCNHLSEILPVHMLPMAFIAVTELPLTSNGKLNRRAKLAVQLD